MVISQNWFDALEMDTQTTFVASMRFLDRLLANVQ